MLVADVGAVNLMDLVGFATQFGLPTFLLLAICWSLAQGIRGAAKYLFDPEKGVLTEVKNEHILMVKTVREHQIKLSSAMEANKEEADAISKKIIAILEDYSASKQAMQLKTQKFMTYSMVELCSILHELAGSGNSDIKQRLLRLQRNLDNSYDDNRHSADSDGSGYRDSSGSQTRSH